MRGMKVAALQMVSTPDVAENLATARGLIAQAARDGAELVALPEYFCLMGRRDTDKLAVAEDATPAPLHSAATPMQTMLAQAAREHGMWVIGGTLPLRAPQADKVFNSLLVFDPQGALALRYDKIHLFCFDNGQQRYDEAATLLPGVQPQAFTLTDRQGLPWRVGVGVCYDLRFPELFRALTREAACDLLVLPAAFTHTTGEAHWELLLRARAVENLCHVLAPAQGGEHPNGRRTWGHSMAINPWGQILAVRPEGPGVVMATLDAAQQATWRQQLPALNHRVL